MKKDIKSEWWGKNGIQKNVGLTPVEDANPTFSLKTLAEMRGFVIFQNISLLLTFSFAMVKSK